jgi:formate hydrogenlyase transcriptional activator
MATIDAGDTADDFGKRSRLNRLKLAALLWEGGIAVASVTAALSLAFILRHYQLPHPFIAFFSLAIAVTFWYAGTAAGVFALLLSCVAMGHFFVPLSVGDFPLESYLIIFGILSVSIARFSVSRRRAERLLTEAGENLEVRVAQRTSQLSSVNAELERAQVELRTEKDRLRLLLELTNNLVSNVGIREAVKRAISSIRQITQSDFVAVSLPDSGDNALQFSGLDFVVDGDVNERDFVAEDDSIPVRVFRSGAVWTGSANEMPGSCWRKESPFSPKLKAISVLPLLSHDRALGVLVVGNLSGTPYAQKDVDFLTQLANQIAIAAENALSYRRISELTEKLSQEKLYLEDEIRSDANFEEIIGTSTELRRILNLVETVAPTDSTVLIYGETGTGKELIARAIHNLSPRRDKTFVKLNCAAIPATLLESELFGHERGAFTGAATLRVGRMELAHHGTLFLDEVGEISVELQPKLLRVLQEREFERLGGTRTVRADVRLIAATNRDLSVMVDEQKFRSDLFFRLNVFPVRLPPLRERVEDIPILVRHFAQEFSRRMNKIIQTISSETMRALCQYRWPGNIRELQNVIERAVILSSGSILNVPVAELQADTIRDSTGADAIVSVPKVFRRKPVRSIVADVDGNQIIQALKQADGRVGGRNGAAALLGLKRTTLITRMKKLGIIVDGVSEHVAMGTDTSDSSKTDSTPKEHIA